MSEVNEKAISFFKDLLSSGHYDDYIERKAAKDFLCEVVGKLEVEKKSYESIKRAAAIVSEKNDKLEAENKRLKEGVTVPRELSQEDIKVIGKNFPNYAYGLLNLWPNLIKRFTTKGET